MFSKFTQWITQLWIEASSGKVHILPFNYLYTISKTKYKMEIKDS